MLYGIHDSARGFTHYLDFFADAGFDCYAITLRGHGPEADETLLIGATLTDYVDDIRRLHAHTGPAVLIGASMGGLLAQKVSELDAPRAAILLAPAPPGGVSITLNPLIALHHLKIVPSVFFKKTIRQDWANARRYVLNMIPPEDRRALFDTSGPESTRVIRDIVLGRIEVDASQVTCPMLIIVGEHDPGLPPRLQIKIARKYGAELWVLPGHSHLLTEEPPWHDTAQKVLRWIEATVGAFL